MYMNIYIYKYNNIYIYVTWSPPCCTPMLHPHAATPMQHPHAAPPCCTPMQRTCKIISHVCS